MSKPQNESRLKSILPYLISPITIGITITFIFSLMAFRYYQSKYDTELGDSKVYSLIDDVNKKSFDYRLQLRGSRPASEDVAVLAVDDRSIEIVGRWPWPRDVMAKAIDNAYKAGAKVIASDIVWSEPSDRADIRFVESLAEKSLLPGDLKTMISEKLKEADPDAFFASTIEKHKSQFVLGNFFSEFIPWNKVNSDTGYLSTCHDLIFNNTHLSKILDAQATPLVVLENKTVVLMPAEFTQAYGEKIQAIEDEVRSQMPEPKTAFERHTLLQNTVEAKAAFCRSAFLNPEKDEIAANLQSNWPTIQEAISGLSFPSFDEWAADFKSRNRLNAVTETLAWTLNLSTITDKAENNGYFNAVLDSDGTIRLSQLVARTGSRYLPSIAFQSYLISKGYNAEVQIDAHPKIAGLKGVRSLNVVDSDGNKAFEIPVNMEGQLIINYAGPRHTIPHASIADLLNEESDKIEITTANSAETKQVLKTEFFKNKILVLGATSIGVFDLRVTPFDENFPGVETHANVIDNLLRQDFFHSDANEDLIMPATMLAIGVLLTLALSHFGALSGMIFTLFVIAIIAFIDKQFLFTKGILVVIALPLFQTIFTYVFLTFYKYFTEERNKKELRATFSKYVSPAIVEEILKDPKNLELGGRKEHVTVFFSDVRGFTTISEKLDPRALSDLLNSYLTPMTDLVFKNRGTLDKYMGDAVMAFFGAPVHYNDHAKWACRCALQSLEKLKDLQEIYAKKNLPQIDIGIGLNTGECSVGNMGSETVRSYTVMGDAVNLASRLEGINKTYGTHIIISEFTHAEVKDDFLCREVDWVRVKGKLKPVKIFELMGEGQKSSVLVETAKYFGEGYELYHQKQFSKAIQLFEQSLGQNPKDETSQIYIERCREFLAEPPPEDWDGVYVMKTK